MRNGLIITAKFLKRCVASVAQFLSVGSHGLESEGIRIPVAIDGYDPIKAAQFAAYLVDKAGGSIDKKKLSKLLYLGERESAAELGHPMFFDACYSIAEGPICSYALRGLNQLSDTKIWGRFIRRNKKTNVISAVRKSKRDNLGSLSEADIAIADAVWMRHGAKSAEELVAWTHTHLPEYTETDGKRIPISDVAMAEAIGLKDAKDYAEGVAEIRDMMASNPFRQAVK